MIVEMLSTVDKNPAAQLAFQAPRKAPFSALALASYLQNAAKERGAKADGLLVDRDMEVPEDPGNSNQHCKSTSYSFWRNFCKGSLASS